MIGPQRPGPHDARERWIEACSRAGWRGAVATEEVPVGDGHLFLAGRVLAAPVHARVPSPREDCAAMDGIAVHAGAGLESGVLPAAAFGWIDTGDPMPAGADAVAERERVEIRPDGGALITVPVRSGRNVRTRGEDFHAGTLLVEAGRRLRPADIAVAAAAGHASLTVARRPAVAIIPTGDEIRPAGSPLHRGDIVDSNSLLLGARAAQAGAHPVTSQVQPDDADTIAAEVRRAAGTADLVLVLAGSSAGRGDHTAAVLDQVGGVAVHGVAVRPGHPVLLGYAKAETPAGVVPVIGVPGYPLAAAVIFELFAMPVLAALQGVTPRPGAAVRAALACDWASPPGLEEWVPVTLAPEAGAVPGVVATPCQGHGAGALSRLVRADAWWPIPIGQGRFGKDDVVEVVPLTAA
jgi:putative molybdopterin biosynthesis protein